MRRYVHFAGLLVVAIAVVTCIHAIADAQSPPSPVEQKIRQALEGDFSEIEAGDGMVDDVIGVIKERGSILDNSVLDFRASGVQSDQPNHPKSKNAFAAEQLLKASRWLERVGSADPDRADLVNRMRVEAVKLLSE